VKGSTKESKVTFLEKKGLTGAEIEEAFKRVPESGIGSIPLLLYVAHLAQHRCAVPSDQLLPHLAHCQKLNRGVLCISAKDRSLQHC